MLKDQAQTIWLGSKENGLFRLVPRNRPYHYEVYHYMNNPSDPYSISDNKISCIDEDHNGRIWIGTYGGGLNLVEEKEDGAIRFIHARINCPVFLLIVPTVFVVWWRDPVILCWWVL